MNPIIILCAKIGIFLSKLGKRGSSFPGLFARKFNPNIITYFKLPKKTVFVTGSNGKTSTATTLAAVYKHAGYKVGHNIKGSNLTNGVISCLLEFSNLFGKIKTDVLIIEIDERYVKEVFRTIKPAYFIINNLSRDQLARNGHFDLVWEDIHQYIHQDTHLILNADDPLIHKFSLDHKGLVTYYGLAKTKYSKLKPDTHSLDITYCPVCQSKLQFHYYHYWNIGNYECLNGDFTRPNPDFEAKLLDHDTFSIDGNIINVNHASLHNVYNLSACYTVARDTGIEKEVIAEALNTFTLNTKRLETLRFAGKECTLLISKNENAVSYNQSLDYILKQPGSKSIVIGFDHVSRRYKLDDLSWLWDVNFELLNHSDVTNIICVGNFAYDIATRLKYAQIEKQKIIICPDSTEMIPVFIEKAENKFYSMFCFEIQNDFKNLLKKDGLL